MALTKTPIELSSTPGIVDNSNATAITIDSSERVGIGKAVPAYILDIEGASPRMWMKDTTASGSHFEIGVDTSAVGLGNRANLPLNLFTNNTTRMTIDSSGNVGIGVVPKTGGSTWQHVQFGGTGNLIARKSDNIVDAMFSNNYYINASNADSYITTGAAARMFMNDNVISFDQAASGSTDAAISWSEAMRIDSSGNVLVGTSTTNIATEGTVIYGGSEKGVMQLSTINKPALYVNRSNTGDLVQFRTGGSTVIGSIGAQSGRLTVGSNSAAGVRFDGTQLVPMNGASISDNTITLGDPGFRFKDLFLSGGVHLGGTGAANKLDDFEEGTWTPVGVNMTVASVVSAKYVKVGRQVHVDGWVNITSGSGSGSAAALSGLPFVSESYSTGVTNSSTSNATINNSHCRSQAGGSLVQFIKDNDTVVNAFDIDAGHILFSITYQTA